MKKAIDYYQELKPVLEGSDIESIKEAITKIFMSFFAEVKEISGMRKAKTDGAYLAIVDELNTKWNSICNKAEKDGFKILVKDAFTAYFMSLDED
jgi:hypothetical protein